jgi:hypothetical protein
LSSLLREREEVPIPLSKHRKTNLLDEAWHHTTTSDNTEEEEETYLFNFTRIIEFDEKDYFNGERNPTLMDIVKDKRTNDLISRRCESSESIVRWNTKDIEYSRSNFTRNRRKQSKEILHVNQAEGMAGYFCIQFSSVKSTRQIYTSLDILREQCGIDFGSFDSIVGIHESIGKTEEPSQFLLIIWVICT